MDRQTGTRPRIEIARQPSLQHIIKRFPKMVMPAVNIYLHKTDTNLEWVIVVAQAADAQQGLIVACIMQQQVMRIVSWYVVPECTDHGLGQMLLAALESWCRKQEIKSLTLDLRDQTTFYERASHILQKQGWSKQRPLVHRFKVAASTLSNLNWNSFQRRPREIEILPWNSLSHRQFEDLMRRYQGNNQFPADIMPFVNEQRIENAVSLGLCRGNRVVGWIIAHQVRPSLIEYSTLYIDPGQRQTGATILLLGESFQRLADTDVDYVIFQIKVDNDLMLRFARKRFQPILNQATLFRCEKPLNTDHMD
ncbi:MAG: GNAT family N-acetyltransferase [Candidatus Thiodiazotropha sp.]